MDVLNYWLWDRGVRLVWMSRMREVAGRQQRRRTESALWCLLQASTIIHYHAFASSLGTSCKCVR